MSLTERLDKSYGGQVFEILVWILNVAAVVFVAIVGWLMSNLVDKVDALDTRTRAVEVSVAALAPNVTVMGRIEDRVDLLTARVNSIPTEFPPTWVQDKLNSLERDIAALRSERRK